MTLGPHRVRPGLGRWPSLAQVTALLTGLLALVLVVELTSDAASEPYDVVLLGSVACGAAATAFRMWRRNSFEARSSAVLLAALVLVGQLLVGTVGVPGGPPSHWSETGVAIVVLAVAIPALVAADARHACRTEQAEHPYAL